MGLRVGVIGAGRIGKIHGETLRALGEPAQLVAVCDPHLDHAWAARLSVPHALTNEDQFFALDLDAIIVASPTTMHATHVMRALECGFHVLCEKPVDFSLDVHRVIAERVARSKVKLQIGFNRRYDLDFEKIAELNKNNKLGTPYLLRITSRDPGLPSRSYLQSSGGMFFDMTIHDFDMARFVMRSDVVEVFAYGAQLIDKSLAEIGDIDTAVVTLKFSNGAFGVIDNSRQAIYGYDQRVELFGSLGSAANDHHREHAIVRSDKAGCHQEPMQSFFIDRYKLSYQRELTAFLRSIHDDNEATPSIQDAFCALKIALAAQESLTARRPISV